MRPWPHQGKHPREQSRHRRRITVCITGGIGHNLPQEAPQAFAQAIVDVDGF
jgi:hypothetical protein